MSLKALKKGENICIDKDGNLLIVNASEPTPTGVTNGYALTYLSSAVLWDLETFTYSLMSYNYATVQACATSSRSLMVEPFYHLSFSSCAEFINTNLMADIHFDFPVFGIYDVKNYEDVYNWRNTTIDSSVAYPYTLAPLSLMYINDTMVYNFTNAQTFYAVSNNYYFGRMYQGWDVTMQLAYFCADPATFSYRTPDSAIVQLLSEEFNLDITLISSLFDDELISMYCPFNQIILNLPNCIIFDGILHGAFNESTISSAILGLSLSTNFNKFMSNPFRLGLSYTNYLYLNRNATQDTVSMNLSADALSDVNVFVPSSMVDIYSNYFTTANVQAYDFNS